RSDVCTLLGLPLEGDQYTECVVRVSYEQAVWLAELPSDVLKPWVMQQLCGALMAAGLRAVIPCERWEAITGGPELSHVQFLLLEPSIQAITEPDGDPKGYAEFLVESWQPVIDGVLDEPRYPNRVDASTNFSGPTGAGSDPENPTDAPGVES